LSLLCWARRRAARYRFAEARNPPSDVRTVVCQARRRTRIYHKDTSTRIQIRTHYPTGTAKATAEVRTQRLMVYSCVLPSGF
jgi:hypothetical protein